MSNNKRHVIVTGGGRGIGRAISGALAEDGFHVHVHFRGRAADAQETLDIISNAGGSGSLIQFDVTQHDETKNILDRHVSEYGAPYGVVLNAGILKDAIFPSLAPEEWAEILNTNLGGFYNVLQPLMLPLIQGHGGGRIVTISSVSGLVGNKGQVAYSASKAGLIGATKALAKELAKREITVNCVAPGFIESEMSAELPVQELCKHIPMRRFGKPEEVASVVSFLFSDGASYLTGQVISPNGGIV